MKASKINKIQAAHCYICGATLLLCLLGIAYMYLLSATVVHVVMQKEVTHQIHETHSKIAQLEAEYISKQNAVSSEIASLQGFVEVGEKVFINKGDSSLALSKR